MLNWFKKKENKIKTNDKQLLSSEENRRAILAKEKEEYTQAGKAWVAVLDTQVNPNDIRNGFFELDWNNEFIEDLLDAGYKGETNEEIVNAWFKTIAMQILSEDGYSTDRNIGYVNIKPIDNNKSEIS